MSGRSDRWQHLVSAAFGLDERLRSKPGAAPDQARAFLESVAEVFPPTIDPVEDFEGYAVRRAVVSLLEALGKDR